MELAGFVKQIVIMAASNLKMVKCKLLIAFIVINAMR